MIHCYKFSLFFYALSNPPLYSSNTAATLFLYQPTKPRIAIKFNVFYCCAVLLITRKLNNDCTVHQHTIQNVILMTVFKFLLSFILNSSSGSHVFSFLCDVTVILSFQRQFCIELSKVSLSLRSSKRLENSVSKCCILQIICIYNSSIFFAYKFTYVDTYFKSLLLSKKGFCV